MCGRFRRLYEGVVNRVSSVFNNLHGVKSRKWFDYYNLQTFEGVIQVAEYFFYFYILIKRYSIPIVEAGLYGGC